MRELVDFFKRPNAVTGFLLLARIIVTLAIVAGGWLALNAVTNVFVD